MSASFFTAADPAARPDSAQTFLASGYTAGPWSPQWQHGGPPSALAVTQAERAIAAETGRSDLVALRLAADFVGPVPVGEVVVHTQVMRAARSAALVHVTVAGAGRDCLLARIWFVRSVEPSPPDDFSGDVPPALPDAGAPLGVEFGYGASLDWRFVSGSFAAPGPAVVWVRPRRELLDGYALSGLARTVLVADSASGVGAELDWDDWSFQNVDLDVHLARPFAGEWVLLDAHTQLGGRGSALARSTISDEQGVVGAGLQTLVVAARRS